MLTFKFLGTDIRTQDVKGEPWLYMNDIYTALGGTLRVKGSDHEQTIIMHPEEVVNVISKLAPSYADALRAFLKEAVFPAYYPSEPGTIN